MNTEHFVPRRTAILAIALLVPISTLAHHSSAMFDDTKTVALHGTVKAFQWTNPHCWIQVLADGTPSEEWSVEMASPNELYRNGWRPTTLRAGDKITVTLHPIRTGASGGQFVSVVTPTGQVLGKPQPEERPR